MGFLGKINIVTSDFKSGFKSAWSEVFGWVTWRVYLIIAVIANLLLWLGAVYIYKSIEQDLTVLHYNVDFGIDLVGRRTGVFFNPVIGLILILFGIIMALLVARQKDFKFFGRLILTTMITTNIFLLVALLAIYLINFS